VGSHKPIQIFSKYLATLGLIGYFPFAPGTIGSLLGFASFWILKPSLFVHLLIIFAGTAAGIYAASEAEKMLLEKDSRKIVIDEFVGYFAAMLFLPQTEGVMLAAFLLFRFFDIIKPVPIRKLEKTLSGGSGVMVDDLVAALYANLVIQIWIAIS
jgi:phosphatidylglycerophosphatase A